MKHLWIISGPCVGLMVGAAFAGANPSTTSEPPYALDIPCEDLGDALQAFAIISGHKLLYSSDLVAGKRSATVRGRYTTEQAVRMLLANTDLKSEVTTSGLVMIRTAAPADLMTAAQSTPAESTGKEGKNQSSDSFRVAEVDQGASTGTASVGDQAAPSKSSPSQTVALQEVVVTAQKREERLQDVPVPVTAIDAGVLTEQNQTRLQDYYTRIPGLDIEVDGTNGVPNLSIRGITTGGQANPTVGVTVDDVPYGASTYIGGGFVSPDLDPSDLARIEVLRGPQGTLYGVSSIGGLLKYVTVDPTIDQVTGRVEVGTGGVTNGEGLGYRARGALNLPVGDEAAVRASGYFHRDPGYIDNLQTGAKGVNWTRAEGGRLSGLWHVSDAWSVKLSALLQHALVHGSPLAESGPGFADLEQSVLRGTGGYEQRFQAYSVNVSGKVGGIDLTSVTGYGINSSALSYDLTPVYGDFTNSLYGVSGSPYLNNLRTEKVSQEIRLSAQMGSRFDWLLGGFFTHEHSIYISNIYAEGIAAGPILAQSLNYYNPTTYQELAAFADMTYHFTDRLDVQLGARESHIKQTDFATGAGPFNGGDTITINPDTHDNAFTYLVTPRLKLAPDVMLYARLASGYRAGGPNANAAVNQTPNSYNPDKTQNYDLGVKADFIEHHLSVDASLYYIDWKNVQVTLEAPSGAAQYIGNGSGAKSEGLELSTELRPAKGSTLSAWVAWNDAELTRDLPLHSSAYGVSGDRLPYSSRFSGNLAADQEFPIAGQWIARGGASLSYVGPRVGIFQVTPQRQIFGGYTRLDLHGGLRYSTWTADLFANNLTDRRAPLTGGLDAPNSYASAQSFIYIQPRTVGLSISKSF